LRKGLGDETKPHVLNIFGRTDGWAEYVDAWAMPGLARV